MKLEKKTIGIICAVVAVVVIGIGGYFFYQSTQPSAKKSWNAYVEALESNNYEAMYGYLSTDSQALLEKDAFVSKYTNIYNGIEADQVKVETKDITSTKDNYKVTYTISMDSVAGALSHEHTMNITKVDGAYVMEWDYSQIFPGMQNGDGIRVNVEEAKRGKILDRSGQVLAEDGIVYSVGIVPGKMDSDTVKKLADKLDISTDSIETALKATWVQDDLFVPVKTIKENATLATELKTIAGVSIQQTTGRVYPYSEVCAHLTGYVQNINAEELEAHKEEGYDANSIIGKTGLESIYEGSLKGANGVSIVIVHNGEVASTIASQQVQDGKDIKTTIDINVQQKIYDQLKQDEGAGVAMDSKTGEVLALVSTPAYDPNDFALGMSTSKWNSLNESTSKPLQNRFIQALCPGSTFKVVTAALGLDNKSITADTNLGDAVDKKWQKDSSWGDYYVKTTQSYDGGAVLKNALIYSDNTFFAKLVLQIGKDNYIKGLQSIGFQEQLDFPYTVTKSTYGEDSDLDKEITLADTGYGQGKLLISPIHLNAIYTAFVNDGSMLQPYLIYDEAKAKVWKESVFSKEASNTIMEDLIATFDHYGGNTSKAGGKTGTAQVGDKEIGWMCAVNDDIALTIMVDDVKNKGESSYVIPMVQAILK